MEIISGIKASKGISIGKVFYKNPDVSEIFSYRVDDPDAELERFNRAKEIALKQIDEMCDKAVKTFGKDTSLVLSVHKHILQDVLFLEEISNNIVQSRFNAEYAVHTAACRIIEIFNEIEDAYFRERGTDITDVASRVITVLSGNHPADYSSIITEPVILASVDFMASDTMLLDKNKILGFISELGGQASHAAILARTINKPAVVGVGISLERLNEKRCIIDGDSGIIVIEPDDQTLRKYTHIQKTHINNAKRLRKFIGVKTKSKNGTSINLYANIGSPTDVEFANENDAEGIGLFRSEFLFMEGNAFPSEQTQFETYKRVLVQMGDKPVTVRTADLGSDKCLRYLPKFNEPNPSLGFRAIRMSLEMTDIFVTQLRALLRASVYGNLSIMFPMIVNENELDSALNLVKIVKRDLKKEKIPHNDKVRIGIMVETPAAAIISDRLAKKVDFFSIGTNDLTQYTIAVDRTNAKVSYLYNCADVGVLRLIKSVVQNAHHAGISVSICGESASDVSLLPFFLALGVDSLSVTPNVILDLRSKIVDIDVNKISNQVLSKIS